MPATATRPKRRRRPARVPTPVSRSDLHAAVDRLPEGCSLEQAMYDLCIWAKIQQGEADVAAGRFYTQVQVEAHVKRWSRAWQRRGK